MQANGARTFVLKQDRYMRYPLFTACKQMLVRRFRYELFQRALTYTEVRKAGYSFHVDE